MLSSVPSSRTKQSLAKDPNSCVILLLGICCFFGALLIYLGSQELYKFKTLVIGHCQVKSLGLKYERHSFFPRWNITILNDNETTGDILMETIGTRSDRWAWIKARRYKVNETYPCYHSQNETSIIQWGWQWHEPMLLKACTFLFFGVILLVIAMVLLVLRRHFQTEFKNRQQQQEQRQLGTLLRNEEQEQVVALQETPPPTYDIAVQQTRKAETRV